MILFVIKAIRLYNVEFSEGDKINYCVMEIRQDGTVTVSTSPNLLKAATKLKKKKKKSTGDTSTLLKHRKQQLGEASYHYKDALLP